MFILLIEASCVTYFLIYSISDTNSVAVNLIFDSQKALLTIRHSFESLIDH